MPIKALKYILKYGLPVLCAALIPALLQADYPSWWIERGAIDTNLLARDYALVNQGQVKWMATNAYDELEEKLFGGAGSNIEAFICNVSVANNCLPINLGQLKYIAAQYYDRLGEVGITNAYPDAMVGDYPWTSDSGDDADYAPANIGQTKYAFSFDLDKDADGLPNWWEEYYFGDLDEVAAGDPDKDGLSNLLEYQNNANPNDADSDDDGLLDSDEVITYSTSPSDPDSDNDGLTDGEEVNSSGTDPNEPSDGMVLLEEVRNRIVMHWKRIYATPFVFTNAPGSPEDLQDLEDALMQLSGEFHRQVEP